MHCWSTSNGGLTLSVWEGLISCTTNLAVLPATTSMSTREVLNSGGSSTGGGGLGAVDIFEDTLAQSASAIAAEQLAGFAVGPAEQFSVEFIVLMELSEKH